MESLIPVIELQEPEQELYSNMRPPFSYYGGKQRLAKRIVKLLPPHTVYVEPFSGSGAVYFKKGLPPITNSRYYREVLSDTNQQLIGFFRDMQDPVKRAELIDRLEWTLYSQDEYRLAKSKNDSWAWFCNISFGFAHIYNAGFGTALTSTSPSLSHFNKVNYLKEFRDRFKYTTIMCEPALKVIQRMDSPQTCFYVDPPYPGTDQGHYSGFSQSDFDELINVLDSLMGSVVLSCYNNASVPDHWIKHEFNTIASSKPVTGKNRNHSEKSNFRDDAKRTECVWIKPASSKMRDVLYLKALENYKHFQSI